MKGRIQVPAFAAVATVLLFIPALVTHSSLTALPYIFFAASALSAQNPPIDAARLDIVPPALWGRAEGIRTFIRSGAQALAPLLFGARVRPAQWRSSHLWAALDLCDHAPPARRQRPLPLPRHADLSDGRRHGGCGLSRVRHRLLSEPSARGRESPHPACVLARRLRCR